MSIETRLRKLEKQFENETGETDLSHLTIEEIETLINAIDNGTYIVVDGKGTSHIPEVQAIDNKINWLEDSSINQMTEEELNKELLKYK